MISIGSMLVDYCHTIKSQALAATEGEIQGQLGVYFEAYIIAAKNLFGQKRA